MTSTLKFVRTPSSLTILLGSKPYNIASTDKVFAEVMDLVKAGASEGDVLAVINRAQTAVQAAAQITPNIAISNGVVTFKGAGVDNSITTRMLEMLDEGFNLVPMALFLENLMENPSYRAVTELYSFLEKGGMPITPDGHFMAYKAVRADFKDIHSGTMDNSIGRVVEMPRNGVDEDKNRTCSAGLHFCSFEYLPHFAHADGHVVLVKINPRDVVAIPADYNDTKGRACRYEVTGEYEDYYAEGGPYFTSKVYDPQGSGVGTESEEGNAADEDGHRSVRGGYAGQDDDGDFDVIADGEFLDSFESFETALDYAKAVFHRYDEVIVEDENGDTLATLDEDGVEVHELAQEDQYFVGVDGDMGDSYPTMEEAVEAAQKQANEYGSAVTINNRDGDFLDSVEPEETNEPVYEVHGDGSYIDEFTSQDEALQYAHNQRSNYRSLEVVLESDGDVLDTIEGFLGTFLVTADGSEKGRFDSLSEAKGEAIRLFGSDRYSRVVVQDSDESEVVVLES